MFFLPPKTILTIFFSKKSLIKGVFCCGATSAGSVEEGQKNGDVEMISGKDKKRGGNREKARREV